LGRFADDGGLARIIRWPHACATVSRIALATTVPC